MNETRVSMSTVPKRPSAWRVLLICLGLVIATAPSVISPVPAAATELRANQTIPSGGAIASPNGYYVLRMQSQGNLVLYAPGNLAVWWAPPSGPIYAGSYAVMQGDGNFVIYAPNGVAVWSTGTHGWNGSVFRLQSDGNLVVYWTNGVAVWEAFRSVTGSQRVLDFNMSGNVLNHGQTGVAQAVVNSINDNTDVATLQEVCKGQFDYIQARVPHQGRFAQTVAPRPGMCNGTAYGIAVFVRDPILRTTETSLPVSAEPRKLLCVDTRRVRACSSHLQNADELAQNQQLAAIADILNPAARAGVPVAIGIDSYETPQEMASALSEFIRVPSGASYRSNDCSSAPASNPVDVCNGPLIEQADHVLYSWQRFAGITGGVTSTTWSDHLPIRSSASYWY